VPDSIEARYLLHESKESWLNELRKSLPWIFPEGRSDSGTLDIPLAAVFELLKDEDPAVRKQAVFLLNSLIPEERTCGTGHERDLILVGDASLETEVVPSLLGMLKDPDWEVRNAVYYTLGHYAVNGKGSIFPLLAALEDEEQSHKSIVFSEWRTLYPGWAVGVELP